MSLITDSPRSIVGLFATRHKTRIVSAASVTGLVALAALTFGARAHNDPIAPVPRPAIEKSLAKAVSSDSIATVGRLQPQRETIRGNLIALYPQGFLPNAITRPPGRFALIVDNRTGLRDVSINIEREAGGRLRSIPLSRAKHLWGEEIQLAAGRYVLTESNHPNWTCAITITQN
jgi:hypothetical protein